MNHLFHSASGLGYKPVIDKNMAECLPWLELGVVTVEGDMVYEASTGDNEEFLDIIYGTIDVYLEDKGWVQAVGKRETPFDSNASGVYIPCHQEYRLRSNKGSKAEIAVCKTASDEEGEAVIVEGDDMVKTFWRGKDNWSRRVTSIEPPTKKLIIGEVYNPAGNWSGAPPHKHDESRCGEEAVLDEFYYFRFAKKDGFALYRIYDEQNLEQLYKVKEGDAIAIPYGYHEVVAGPGYDMWYLYVLAGPKKENIVWTDPKEKWLWD